MKNYILFILFCLFSFKGRAQLPGIFNLVPAISSEPALLPRPAAGTNCWMNANAYWSFSDNGFYDMYIDDTTMTYREILSPGMLWLNTHSDFWNFGPASYFRFDFSDGKFAILDTPGIEVYRSYPECKLLEPLIAGTTYTFTMYVALMEASHYPAPTDIGLFYPSFSYVKNIGAYFSDTPISYTTKGRLPLRPQLNFTSWTLSKKDTLDYVQLRGTYMALGGEQYITLGNFDAVRDFEWIGPIWTPSSFTAFDTVSEMSTNLLAYQYLTNISLVRDTTRPMLSLLPLDLGPGRSICPGDTVIARAQPYYYSYRWSTGDTTNSIVIDHPGTYWCTATLGCTTMTDTLKVSTAVIASFDIRDTIICPKDSFVASAPPGHKTYLWSNGATTATQTITAPGRYWVRVSDPCTAAFTDSFRVGNFAPGVTAFDLPDTSICGSGLDILGPPAPHYLWSTGDTTRGIGISLPGTYALRIYDDCGNSFTDSFRFRRQSHVASFRIPDTSYCGSALISGPEAPHYLWSTGDTTQAIRINKSGHWKLTLSDDCGNSYSDSFYTHAAPAIHPFHIGDLQLCGKQIHAEVSRSMGQHFLWSTGDTSTSTLLTTTGKHWVQAFDACGGSYTDTFDVLPPNVTGQSRDTMICTANGKGQIKLPPGAYDIRWNTGETTAQITVTEPGTYFAQAFVNCAIYYDTILVSYCRPQINSMYTDKEAICAGECVQYNTGISNYPVTVSWDLPGGQPDHADGLQAPLVCYQNPGTYTATLIASGKGGADTSTCSITVLDKPQAAFDDSALTLSYDHMLTLFPCATGLQIDWYKNDSLVCGNCNSIQITGRELNEHYRCVVSNGTCADSCSYTLHVVDIPQNAWMPNAFSPNGDSRNETFGIVTDNPNIQVVAFSIYGRYGERVYHAENSNRPWDGTYQGKAQEVGTYYWQLSYKVAGSETQYYLKGDVSLLR